MKDEVLQRNIAIGNERETTKERIKREITFLENNRISEVMKNEYKRMFGSRWKEYSFLLKAYKKQRKLEDKKLNLLRRKIKKNNGEKKQ